MNTVHACVCYCPDLIGDSAILSVRVLTCRVYVKPSFCFYEFEGPLDSHVASSHNINNVGVNLMIKCSLHAFVAFKQICLDVKNACKLHMLILLMPALLNVLEAVIQTQDNMTIIL